MLFTPLLFSIMSATLTLRVSLVWIAPLKSVVSILSVNADSAADSAADAWCEWALSIHVSAMS